MKFLFLIFLSLPAFAGYDATCTFGNHRSQHFRETGYNADEACLNARIACEGSSGMVCFEIDREEGYDDGGYYGDYDYSGYDSWDVINGRRVNQIVCKVLVFTRRGSFEVRKSGSNPREACRRALRECQSQIGPRGSCGRPELVRGYRH